jgi:hypothetical protein
MASLLRTPRLGTSLACSKCGTAWTYQCADLPDSIDVTLGSMDDPEALSPEDHAWTESQLSWISLGDELPAYRRERKLE